MPVRERRDWGSEFKDMIDANYTLEEMVWFEYLSKVATPDVPTFEHDSPYDWGVEDWDQWAE